MSTPSGSAISGGSHTDVPFNIVNGTHSQLVAYLVLNVWPSHFGLPILLIVITTSKKIQRSATFLNMLVVWIIVGISSSLLLYAGKITGPEPPKMFCLFQASLIYGMPPMTSTAAFALVLQMFLCIRKAYLGKQSAPSDGPWRLWLLLVAPYVALLVTAIATASVGAANPTKISRNRRFFYCSVEADPLTNTMTIAAAFILFATVVFEVWTVVLLYRLSRAQKRNGGKISAIVDLSFPIRIIAFGFYIILALNLSLLSIKTPRSPAPDLIISTAATVVIVIFGTQKDILRAMCFWRRSPRVSSPVDFGENKLKGDSEWTRSPFRISIR